MILKEHRTLIDCPDCEGIGEIWTGYNRNAPIGSWAECGDHYECPDCKGTGELEGEE